MNHPIITTPRLNIYPASDAEMRKLIEDEPIEELKVAYAEMLENCLQHPEQRLWHVVWFAELKDEKGVRIGSLSFKGLSDECIVEIGYGTNAGFEGQGYMTEELTALVRWASMQDCVHRIEAETDKDNKASQKVLEKSGFVPIGDIGEEGPRFVWAGD